VAKGKKRGRRSTGRTAAKGRASRSSGSGVLSFRVIEKAIDDVEASIRRARVTSDLTAAKQAALRHLGYQRDMVRGFCLAQSGNGDRFVPFRVR
jgi:hypothetical protein